MYQYDVRGNNAIHQAFKKNAIFCIKAFVETLLILPEEVQFRNCFDKALLLMIQRGIDVKDLVNSQMFYASVWKRHTLFSDDRDPILFPYNNDIEDIEYENPKTLFSSQDDKQTNSVFKLLGRAADCLQSSSLLSSEGNEQFEMQYNYIYMEEIQGEFKIEVSKTLKDCTDIELFEQESIQHIIDYKWNTYARNFFLLKFLIYIVFLGFYGIDLESIHLATENGMRIKEFQFYI